MATHFEKKNPNKFNFGPAQRTQAVVLWFNSCNLQFTITKLKYLHTYMSTYLSIFGEGGDMLDRSRKVGHMDYTSKNANAPVMQMCISKQYGCINSFVPMG